MLPGPSHCSKIVWLFLSHCSQEILCLSAGREIGHLTLQGKNHMNDSEFLMSHLGYLLIYSISTRDRGLGNDAINSLYHYSVLWEETQAWWSWGVAGLSLGAFSLNLLRLLCLGLIQSPRKVELFYGGEVLTFQIIP